MRPYSKLENSLSRMRKGDGYGSKRNFTTVIIRTIREFTAILCIWCSCPETQ